MEENWHRIKRIFQRAIELPEDKQHAYVRSQSEDAEVCQRVLEMLKTHIDDSGFLSSPLHGNEDAEVNRDPLIGNLLGQFKVIRRIGKGGIGAVYEARQQNPDRLVAVKVLRHDTSVDDRMLSRFRNEAGILARLQHPNIANVFASGTFRDEDGVQPWFAMELIDGLTLGHFLHQHKLNLRQKLALFQKICDGVSHAHRREVIHRDLKPDNILITDRNEEPKPKIVDFGIARFAAQENMTMTRTQAVLGSIDYLSPEQVDFERTTLDHRCDVYALGVILFEILTGRLPHDRRSASFTKVMSQIQFEPGLHARQVDRSIARDLDVIIAKAMATEAGRRYQSVDALSEDLRRFTSGEPILARPPSTYYQLCRYVSRNRILVGGAATTIAALLIGIVAYAISADRANRAAAESRYEARKANAINSFVTNDFMTMLLQSVRSSKDGSSIDVGKVVEESASAVDAMFADEPLHEAAVRNEIGTIYYNIRQFDKAESEYALALQLWEAGLGPDHPDTLKAVSNLAQTYIAASKGKEPRTLKLCRRAYESRKRVLGPAHEATIRSLNNLAHVYRSRKKYDDAAKLFQEGLAMLTGSTAETLTTKATMASSLGQIYIKQGQIDEALALNESSLASVKGVLGDDHPLSMQLGIRYVRALDKAGRYQEAMDVLEPVVLVYESMSESDPAVLFIPLRLQARILKHQEQLDLAKEKLEFALSIAEKSSKYRSAKEKILEDLRDLSKWRENRVGK